MSRPNHALALGLSRAWASTALLGDTFVNSEGQMAISTKSAMRTTENQKTQFFFSDRHASEASERASSTSPPSRTATPASATPMVDASVMADPRVEHAVQEVDEQVG